MELDTARAELDTKRVEVDEDEVSRLRSVDRLLKTPDVMRPKTVEVALVGSPTAISYSESPLTPPQISPGFPVHTIEHLPSVATVDVANSVFPQ